MADIDAQDPPPYQEPAPEDAPAPAPAEILFNLTVNPPNPPFQEPFPPSVNRAFQIPFHTTRPQFIGVPFGHEDVATAQYGLPGLHIVIFTRIILFSNEENGHHSEVKKVAVIVKLWMIMAEFVLFLGIYMGFWWMLWAIFGTRITRTEEVGLIRRCLKALW